MVTAQPANRVDDLIHLPQLHSVHLPIQFVEVFPDRSIIHLVGISVGFVEQCQYRFTVSEVWRIFCDMGSQSLEIVIQANHLQSVVMLTLKSQKRK